MNKKGSMELSVNSIVILVIAIVMLGLILGFVRSKFGDLNKQLVNNEPEAQAATPSDRITVSRETVAVSGGEEATLKVQVYAVRAIFNTSVDAQGNADATAYKPTIICSGGELVLNPDVLMKNVDQGGVGTYTLNIKIPAVAKGKYLCSLGFKFPKGTDSNANPEIDLAKDLVFEIV